MLGYVARIAVVGVAAALLVAPATQLVAAQAAERELSPAREVAQVTSAPSPSAGATASPTAIPMASPTASSTASATPKATASPTPTASPAPTPNVAVKPTAKPEAARTPEAKAKDHAWSTVVWACFAQSGADACLKAIAKSGLSVAALRERTVARLEEIERLQAERADLEILLQTCVASGGIESDACMRAWTLSGLSLEEFKAVVLKKMQGAKPSDPAQSEREKWLQKCIGSRELYGEACYRAWELSGLSSEEFDKKINAIWASRR